MSFSIIAALPTASEDTKAILVRIQDSLNKSETNLRDDSILAWKYASGELPNWIFEDIVFELLLMRYLYEYTNYTRISQAMVLQWQMEKTDAPTSDVLKDWVLPLAKIKALRESGIPSHWPWLA